VSQPLNLRIPFRQLLAEGGDGAFLLLEFVFCRIGFNIPWAL
jgi:hypothetical protein